VIAVYTNYEVVEREKTVFLIAPDHRKQAYHSR